MMPKTCSYCKQSGKLTREHLWPASLHRRLLEVNNQTSSFFWLSRLSREIPSEPKIHDVCATCNNVVLSRLDAYICKFFDTNLVEIPQRFEEVAFEHDYHLLKRWLLKICYNSARIHSSADSFALEAVLPYILGKDDHLGRSVQLFVHLLYPEQVPPEDRLPEFRSEEDHVFVPAMNRVGHMHFVVSGLGRRLLRTVHLRAFCFVLAFSKPGNPRSEQDFFAKLFQEQTRSLLLRPSQPKVTLECNGMGAWTSFKYSRSAVARDDLAQET